MRHVTLIVPSITILSHMPLVTRFRISATGESTVGVTVGANPTFLPCVLTSSFVDTMISCDISCVYELVRVRVLDDPGELAAGLAERVNPEVALALISA